VEEDLQGLAWREVLGRIETGIREVEEALEEEAEGVVEEWVEIGS
jgi:hypothetical protein